MHRHYNDWEIVRRKHLTWTTVAIAAGVAMAGTAMVMSSQKEDTPSFTPPAAPSTDDAKMKAQEAITKKRRGAARNATNFTGPMGLNNEEKSGLTTKTLLGE